MVAPRPTREAAFFGLLLLLSGCGGEAPIVSAESLGVAEAEPAALPFCPTSSFTLDTLAHGLETPWDVAFLSDGTAFVTERAGRILRFPAAGGAPEPWLDIDVHSPAGSEIGLMGVDLSPDGGWLYFSATERASSGLLARIGRRLAYTLDREKGHPIRLTAYRVPTGGSAADIERVIEPIPAGFIHGGGALRFGPDGALFLTNGDGGDHWRSQVASSYRGKLYDLEPPAPGDPALSIDAEDFFATGIRHSQGLAWTGQGHLLAIDHGPTGLDSEWNRTDHDEVNIVSAGDNLGWPVMAGTSTGAALVSPIFEWTPALAPAGLAWFDDPDSDWHSSVFATGLRGTRLVRLQLSDQAGGVVPTCREDLLHTDHGRLRLVRQAPDGSLWVGTSNRDGRGVPRDGDDLILRLLPAGSDR